MCYIQLLVRHSDLVACINLRKLGVSKISNILSPRTCRLAAVHGSSCATTVGERQPQFWNWVSIVVFASEACSFIEGRRALNSLPLNFKVFMESPVYGCWAPIEKGLISKCTTTGEFGTSVGVMYTTSLGFCDPLSLLLGDSGVRL